jgi:hypothetical protein
MGPETSAVSDPIVSAEEQIAMFEVPPLDEDSDISDTAYVPAIAEAVVSTLTLLRADIQLLRDRRAAINTAIKQRVAYEAHLERMARIATEVLKEVNDGNEAHDADDVVHD